VYFLEYTIKYKIFKVLLIQEVYRKMSFWDLAINGNTAGYFISAGFFKISYGFHCNPEA
jgi:hypothetical protein